MVTDSKKLKMLRVGYEETRDTYSKLSNNDSRNLGKVDRDFGWSDTDANTAENAPCNKLPIALARNLHSSIDEPSEACKEESVTTIHLLEIGPAITDPTTEPATRKESTAPWMMPCGFIEIFDVLIRAHYDTHRRDIEIKASGQVSNELWDHELITYSIPPLRQW